MAIINSELFVYQGVMGLHGIQKQLNTVKCVCHRDNHDMCRGYGFNGSEPGIWYLSMVDGNMCEIDG